MLVHLTCPNCGDDGTDLVEAQDRVASCPRCGTRLAFATLDAEDLVASWLGEAPGGLPPAPGPDGDDLPPAPSGEVGTCPACGYSGAMLSDPTMAYPACPACGASQRDRAIGRLIRTYCPECQEPIEAERGRSVVCPHCKCFLGCLFPEPRKSRWWRRPG